MEYKFGVCHAQNVGRQFRRKGTRRSLPYRKQCAENTDWFSTTLFSITYEFGRKKKFVTTIIVERGMTYVEQINLTRVPKHIAIIMDGNGRWAKERGLDRSEGHRKGLDVVHEITDAAAEVGVQYLTLYAFSTENWNRPQAEVDALMALVVFGIERETPGMVEKGVRLSVIGDLDRLPSDVKARLLKCIRDTSGGERIVLNLALSYSSRWEIARAARCIAQEVQRVDCRWTTLRKRQSMSL